MQCCTVIQDLHTHEINEKLSSQFIDTRLNFCFTNEFPCMTWWLVTVIPTVLRVSVTSMEYESITEVRICALITTAAYSWGKERDVSSIRPMCPDIINAFPISPKPFVSFKLLGTVSQKAVVLLQVVDLHQPTSIQDTLTHRVIPVMFDVREKVFMSGLQKLIILKVISLIVIPDNPNLSTLEESH